MKPRALSLPLRATCWELSREEIGQLSHDREDLIALNNVLVSVVLQNGEFMLVGLHSFDQHGDLLDRVETIMKTNQTLREEVDLALARHPEPRAKPTCRWHHSSLQRLPLFLFRLDWEASR